ncbi:hypothetical protein ABE10_02045, partial [Bacillus toyonensis]|nr:hypothetical protein [Bacillus toyonensis]
MEKVEAQRLLPPGTERREDRRDHPRRTGTDDAREKDDHDVDREDEPDVVQRVGVGAGRGRLLPCEPLRDRAHEVSDRRDRRHRPQHTVPGEPVAEEQGPEEEEGQQVRQPVRGAENREVREEPDQGIRGGDPVLRAGEGVERIAHQDDEEGDEGNPSCTEQEQRDAHQQEQTEVGQHDDHPGTPRRHPDAQGDEDETTDRLLQEGSAHAAHGVPRQLGGHPHHEGEQRRGHVVDVGHRELDGPRHEGKEGSRVRDEHGDDRETAEDIRDHQPCLGHSHPFRVHAPGVPPWCHARAS